MEGIFVLLRFAVAVVLASAIAVRAFKRRSLDRSGAIAGFVVMAIHIAAGYRSESIPSPPPPPAPPPLLADRSGLIVDGARNLFGRYGAMLLVFFFSSSKLTKIGQEKKRSIEEDFKEGGQRNWVQVLANSGLASVLVIVLSAMTRGQDRCLNSQESKIITGLIGGVIGHYACCNGDTWSSEIGVLSSSQPRLITNFKAVRKGTNGAVTIQGLLAATAAGFVIGLTYVIVGLLTTSCASDVAWRQLLVIPIAAGAGLFGSLVDSFLGATLQFSGYCKLRKKVVSKRSPTVIKISGRSVLDNNAVNAVSILFTTLITSIICLYI